jgi:hypothetical protein
MSFWQSKLLKNSGATQVATEKVFNCNIVGSSGPRLILAIVKEFSESAAFVRAVVVCDVRNAPNQWLFACPLGITSKSRFLADDLNVLDLVFLGHQIDSSGLYSVHSTLAEMLVKIPTQLEKVSIKYPSVFTAAKLACNTLFNGVSEISGPTSDSFLDNIFDLDKVLSLHVEVRLVDSTGLVVDHNVPITSIAFTQWLANYLSPEFSIELKKLKEQIK